MSKLKRLNQILLGLLLFFLPWQTAYIFDAKFLDGAKWQYGTGLIYTTEILLWLIAILYLIIAIEACKKQIPKIKYQKNKLLTVIGLWLLLAWAGSSLIWAPAKTAGFYNWFHLLEAAGLFFIILTSAIDKKKIYLSLTLAGVLQALLAIWQFFSQGVSANKWLGLASHLPWETGTIIIESSGRWLRAYGSFAHPNVLGGFLVICFFATIIPALMINGRRNTPWRIIASLLLLSGIFFSFSRSAWLALIAGLAIIFVSEIYRARQSAEPVDSKYRNLIKYFLTPLVLAAVLALIYQPVVFTRISTSDRLETYSVNDRLDYLSQAEDMIKNHRVIGVGEGNYTYDLFLNDAAKTPWHYQPVHNIFLLIWAELGLVGLIIFIIFLISLFLNFLISNRADKSHSHLNIIVFCTTILIIGFFDHYFWTSYVGLMMLFICFALMAKKQEIGVFTA